MAICAPTCKILLRNFGSMLILADFPANFTKFQNSVEQSIFELKMRLIYEKVSIFNGKHNEIKIKQFA